jgi:acyl carrier protein
MEREQGLSRICAAVTDCLGLPPGKVTPTSRLITDLGATSLDILDLIFTLEDNLGATLRDGDLEAFLRGELVSSKSVRDGFLVAEAVDRLARFLPAIADLPDRNRLTPGQVIPLITVESIWLLVQRNVP